MKKRYGDRARLLFTDTDSLMYEVETEDIYNELVNGEFNDQETDEENFHTPNVSMVDEVFDFSNYPPNHPFYRPNLINNKAQVGFMKDETAANPIIQYVGLRPKMYSFKAVKFNLDPTVEPEYFEKHRAKGIQRVVAANFTHEQYLDQLQHPEENHVLNRRLGSRLHNIYGIEVPLFLLNPIPKLRYD